MCVRVYVLSGVGVGMAVGMCTGAGLEFVVLYDCEQYVNSSFSRYALFLL